jgi:hypothetical protein
MPESSGLKYSTGSTTGNLNSVRFSANSWIIAFSPVRAHSPPVKSAPLVFCEKFNGAGIDVSSTSLVIRPALAGFNFHQYNVEL